MKATVAVDVRLLRRASAITGIRRNDSLVRRSLRSLISHAPHNGRPSRNGTTASRSRLLAALADQLGKTPLNLTLAELRRQRRLGL